MAPLKVTTGTYIFYQVATSIGAHLWVAPRELYPCSYTTMWVPLSGLSIFLKNGALLKVAHRAAAASVDLLSRVYVSPRGIGAQ